MNLPARLKNLEARLGHKEDGPLIPYFLTEGLDEDAAKAAAITEYQNHTGHEVCIDKVRWIRVEYVKRRRLPVASGLRVWYITCAVNQSNLPVRWSLGMTLAHCKASEEPD